MSTDGGARPDLVAKRLGYIAAVLCGLLIVATVVLTLWGLSIRAGTSDGMFVSMAFIVMLPGASIPVAIFCLIGAMLSKKALRTTSSTDARTGLWLCAGGPVAVVLCYAACFWVLTAWGN
jgi:hypothetical protein